MHAVCSKKLERKGASEMAQVCEIPLENADDPEIQGILNEFNKVAIIGLSNNEENSVLQLELTEGKKREIKRIFAMLGYYVKHLKRIRFADISCEGMRTGSWRYLNRKEVSKLKRKVDLQ